MNTFEIEVGEWGRRTQECNPARQTLLNRHPWAGRAMVFTWPPSLKAQIPK